MDYLYIFVIIILLSILMIIIYNYSKKVKENRELKAGKTQDIVETNKLLLKKSENELKLFFEFEAAVEETIKIGRKSLSLNKEILFLQQEITRLLKSDSS